MNSDLDPLQFLITLAHEVAHVHTWNRYENRVTPHGKEWKAGYQRLLRQLLALDVLDAHDTELLYQHSLNPKASSSLDDNLSKLNQPEPGVILNHLQPGHTFRIDNGRVFQAVRKLRKYWLCKEPESERYYRVRGSIAVTVMATEL